MSTLNRQRALINPAQAWSRLPPEIQQEIGRLAIAMSLGHMGVSAAIAPRSGFLAAEAEGLSGLCRLIEDRLVEAFDGDGQPLLPDVTILGIKACRTCFCTDAFGCPEGCSWISPNLCSSCAQDARGSF